MKTKTNKNRKITSIILALAVAFAYLPAMTNADYGKAAKKPGKVTVKTSKKKPGKVKGLKVVKKGKRSVTLKWRKAKRAKKYFVYEKMTKTKWKNMVIRSYHSGTKDKHASKVKKSHILKNGWENIFIQKCGVPVIKFYKVKATKKNKVTVKKLQPGTTQVFKVVAKNKAGKGKESKKISAKVKKSKLTKREKKLMKQFTLKNFSFNNGSVNWNTAIEPKAGTDTYYQYSHPEYLKKHSMRYIATHYEFWTKKKNRSKWKMTNTESVSMQERDWTGMNWCGYVGYLNKTGSGYYYAKMRLCKGNFKGPFTKVEGDYVTVD